MYGGRNYSHSHHHHHHYPNHHHKIGLPSTGTSAMSPESALATDIFEQFIAASTFKSVLHHYRYMCDVLRLKPQNIRHFYPKLKSKIRSWKAQALWSKFDKRASHKCYNHGKACTNTKVLIIGAGPCGLRSAIEAQLLGAKVVVVEKRDRFSRNNVLHLWPFVITDLKALGAKKFYGKFCAGAIDHISIRQLQCILLKVALLLGVEVFEGVTFEELLEPPEDQSQYIGWHARFSPMEHPVNQYEFDVLIGADGKRNTLMGFKRKEFRGKLAIAITANFINKHSEQEARVQEISGVAFIFNQKFFKDLYAATGIDLENIVYYKDETHYFVMTAKKHSLIDKGVILRDLPDTQQLLHPNNVDRKALCDYAREAADFSTGYQMPHLEFAVNHYGKPDIAMFDFTSMFAAENACRVVEKNGHKLLQCLVGDSLLEPFWPTGSGCARGFLSSFDACWAVRSWSSNKMTSLEVIAERESIYRLLAQTTPENLSKDYSSYTLEPSSRYPTVNLKVLLPFQVRHLCISDDPENVQLESGSVEMVQSSVTSQDKDIPRKRKRRDSIIHPDTLLLWCQKQVAHCDDLKIENLGTSFKDGFAFCSILHRYRPDLIDLNNLDLIDHAKNCQLAFDIIEREFGIPPVISGFELANMDLEVQQPDLISYIAQIHDALRGEIPHSMGARPPLKVLKGEKSDELDLEDFPNVPKEQESEKSSFDNAKSSSSVSSQINARVSCRILEEPIAERVSKEDMMIIRKRRNEMGSLDKMNEDIDIASAPKQNSQDFSDRVKGLEAKFRGEVSSSSHQKPKDMIRAIGKLEKTDWNISAIERKIEENPKPVVNSEGREKVPKWSRDTYNEKYHNIERRLRENGEDEERIAKYLDIDASLKRLERKLREGSTLETGLRGHNKVSNLANQLSSKLVRKDDNSTSKSTSSSSKQTRAMVLPSRGSDLCYFCNTRVYLVERLSTEGKFFHRQCFKCSYCGALLRLGNYIYDRENRYGGKFFCVPHFGLSVRSKGGVQKAEKDAVLAKDEEPTPKVPAGNLLNKVGTGNIISEASIDGSPKLLSPPSMKVSPAVDRGTTPERVEFENSVIEHSDEEEYLSEEEWTDRNFGASANELDEDDDDSDYSDLSDEEVDEEALLETSQKLTVDETRRLAESWKRRYSNDMLLSDDGQESFSDSDENDIDYVSEHGAEGDESHTPTEGEIGEDDDDDDDDEGENVRRARELRRLEVNINVGAPPRKAETSDSGSETEVGSEDESDTQIDTDSEFEEDLKSRRPPKEIPTIVIDETPVKELKEECNGIKSNEAELKTSFSKNSNDVQFFNSETEIKDCNEKEGTERSASLSNLLNSNVPNPHTEQLKRLLQRTESSEFVSAQRNQLRRQYLLGNTPNVPRKSVSTADLGNRFKSFMDKISETQKKLNPAPQPSPAMQAFLNLSNKTSSTSPLLQPSSLNQKPSLSLEEKRNSFEKLEDKPVDSKTFALEEDESSDSSKSEEGKLITFSNVKDSEPVSEISSKEKSSTVNFDGTQNNNNDECFTTSPSHYVGTKSKDEKGVLDSEQSEKLNIEKELFEGDFGESFIPAENVKVIEAFNENKQPEAINLEIININEVSNASQTLDEDEQVEAINLELINTDNVDNVSESSSYHCNEDDVEADFDQLANDALTEINQSKLADDVLENVGFDEGKEGERINLKDKVGQESNQQSNELALESVDSLEPDSKKSDLEVEIVKEICLSPETEIVTTEADLSDWGDENEAFSIHADDFEADFHEDSFSFPKASSDDSHPKLIARIASLESLGDSDSATSVNDKQKQVESTLVSTALTEPEPLNYVDTSGSECSSENTQSVNIQYNKLQDTVATRSESVSREEEVALISDSPYFISNSAPPENNMVICFSKTSKSKSLDTEETLDENTPTRSLSDPHCRKPCESNLLSAETSLVDSSSDSPSMDSSNSKLQSPGRYEGYIPRFKGRVTPFSLARDSIDVRKNSVPKPLFTPSKEDILEREKNQAIGLKSVPCKIQDSSQLSSPTSTSSSHRVKDGDLVRDMVLSRINKKSNDKTRRGSRNALHLSLHSSSSSIFGSEPSLDTSKFSLNAENENSPLDKFYTATNINNSTFKDNGNGTVPSEENSISRDFNSDISCKLPSLKAAVTKNSEEEKFNHSLRNVLPATPLTHPEKFHIDDLVKKDIFKSSPQLNQASLFSTKSFQSTKKLCSPDEVYSQRFPSELPVLPKQNVHLSASLTTNVYEPHAECCNHRISSGFRDRDTNPQNVSNKVDTQEALNKDQSERLKELLEERRRKENEEDVREVRLRNKDTCIQDCLEEYRQKRSSAPVLSPSKSPNRDMIGMSEPVQTRIQLVLPKRHIHRPSLLELESMQIFSSSRGAQENTPTTDSLATPLSNLNNYDSISNFTTSGQSPSGSIQNESNSVQEKKPIKKSKDRERRRSLIQVVAGMFTKSEEKKKEKEDNGDSHSPEAKSSSPPSSNLSSIPPKSPSVKERFSKLRISRSKKKSSSKSKMRSSSVGTTTTKMSSSSPENDANSVSLPTSPSRTLFSFLSSSVPARLYDKNKTSSSGSATSYFGHRFSPSCIKEENNSEEESNQEKASVSTKDSTLSTPSLRRQRAAQRAAKQAEQKRLRMAQEIQRQLEECEVKTRELEERGINVEKALTGEVDASTKDEDELMKEWFSLVHEKNGLVRWQEELAVKARELELEDRHLRLENELRQRMTSSEREKKREDIEREGQILGEIISIIEQKDALVNMQEEDRQRCGTSRNPSSSLSNPSLTRNPFSNSDNLHNESNYELMHLETLIPSLNLEGVSLAPFENGSRFLSADVLRSYNGLKQIYTKPLCPHKKSIFDKNLFSRFNKRNTSSNEPKKFFNHFLISPPYTFFKLFILFLFICMFFFIIFPNIITAILSKFEVIYRKSAF